MYVSLQSSNEFIWLYSVALQNGTCLLKEHSGDEVAETDFSKIFRCISLLFKDKNTMLMTADMHTSAAFVGLIPFI